MLQRWACYFPHQVFSSETMSLWRLLEIIDSPEKNLVSFHQHFTPHLSGVLESPGLTQRNQGRGNAPQLIQRCHKVPLGQRNICTLAPFTVVHLAYLVVLQNLVGALVRPHGRMRLHSGYPASILFLFLHFQCSKQ